MLYDQWKDGQIIRRERAGAVERGRVEEVVGGGGTLGSRDGAQLHSPMSDR